MSDRTKLNKAQELFEHGAYPEARKLLEEITSRDPYIRINVLSSLIAVLDHLTENDKLMAVVNEGIELAEKAGNVTMRDYFLGKKCTFLMTDLSNMIYRQKNLMLSAQVFEWVGFSLEKDKKEYETITEARKKIEAEIDSTLASAIDSAERSSDHDFKGHQFSTIGDAYSSKYLADKLDFQEGGRLKSKIANLHYVRRWNLDRYLYTRDERGKIDQSRANCIKYFERSVEEFRLAGKKSEEAHAIYNLAAKMLLWNNFRRINKLLPKARAKAEAAGDKRLIVKIEQLEKRVLGETEMRDYVREMGLDMPDGHRPSM